MEYAERNRKIKKLLEGCFGRGKVTVRMSRGTAYGWLTVNIDYTPHHPNHRSEIIALIWKMFERDGIEIGTYGYDDPGSDYGFGKKIHLNFNPTESATEYEYKMGIKRSENDPYRLGTY